MFHNKRDHFVEREKIKSDKYSATLISHINRNTPVSYMNMSMFTCLKILDPDF